MKRYIKTLIIAFSLLSVTNAFAVVPLLGLPAWAWVSSLAINTGVAATLMYRAVMKGDGHHSPSPAKVQLDGSVKRPTDFVWIDAKDMDLKQQSVDAKISHSKIQEIANAKKTEYPGLYDATHSLMIPEIQTNTPSGSIVSTPFGLKKTTSTVAYQATQDMASTTQPTTKLAGGRLTWWVYSHVVDATLNWYKCYGVNVEDTPPPPKTPNTPTEFVANAKESTGDILKDNLKSELDKMLQDPDYVPEFSDALTGLPAGVPAGIASQAQVDAENARRVREDARQQAIQSGTTAVTSATGLTDAARDRYTASGGDPATGQGGDPGLYSDYLKAKAGSDAAQAGLDALNAQLLADGANDDPVTAPSAPGAYGDGTTHDFSARFSSFMQSMKSSSIFGAPGQILGSIPGGGQSYFALNFGRFGQTTFDLADYGTAINIIKTLVLAIFSIAGLRIVTLKGGS